MSASTPKRFVIVTGLPGSGKTTLAEQLAPLLDLPVIDKDSILETLFASRGVGDAAWRRRLSRESDGLLVQQAQASGGAILVSFWRQPGMPFDSGTPTAWLSGLAGRIVHVHCVCPPEIAAERFWRRHRHPGHLDLARSYDDILESLRRLAELPPLEARPHIEVDTGRPVDLEALRAGISAAFNRGLP